MKSSVCKKLAFVAVALAVLLVGSRAFAQPQATAIGVQVSSLTLDPAGNIQMAYYNGGGTLAGGKIIDDQFKNDPDPTGAIAYTLGTIQPLINQAQTVNLDWSGQTGFTDLAAWQDAQNNGGTGLTATAAVVNGALFEDGNGNYPPAYSTFAGKSVTANSILIGHTWYGDTQLKGYVNIDDYNNFVQGSNSGGFDPNGNPGGWAYGDFTGDGQVNIDDYNLFVAGSNGSTSELFPEAFGAPTASAKWVLTVGSGTASPVPEPGTLALLAALGALVAARAFIVRRKKVA